MGVKRSFLNRRYAMLTLVYCMIIFALSSISRAPEALQWVTGHDLALHAMLYAGLGWLAAMTLRTGAVPWRGWRVWAMPVAFAAVYGASDELHQLMVPGRYCALVDWVADVAGAAAVQAVFVVRNLRRAGDGT